MKKTIMILTLGSLMQPCFADLDTNEEAFTLITAGTTHVFTSSGTWNKQKEIDALGEELEVYDLTGEVRPELASFIEEAMAENEGSTFKAVLDELRTQLTNSSEEQ